MAKKTKIKLKQFWKSKTFWVNVVAIISGVVTSLLGQLEAGVSITLMGLIGLVLRTMTKNGIVFSTKELGEKLK